MAAPPDWSRSGTRVQHSRYTEIRKDIPTVRYRPDGGPRFADNSKAFALIRLHPSTPTASRGQNTDTSSLGDSATLPGCLTGISTRAEFRPRNARLLGLSCEAAQGEYDSSSSDDPHHRSTPCPKQHSSSTSHRQANSAEAISTGLCGRALRCCN